jgi:hypothetical protein
LGLNYSQGRGVAKDYSEAVKWWRKAAEQNDAKAQYNLGTCYATGQGVEEDVVEAVKWWRKAAEQNHAEAQYNLGVCYANGQGVAKDQVEAVVWYRKAAEQNYEPAKKTMTELERRLTREQVAEGQKRAGDFKSSEVPSFDAQRGEPASKPLADLRAKPATGDAPGQKALGQALPAGKGGAAKDNAEAVKWFTYPDNRKEPSGDRAKDEVEASKWYLLALRANAATGNAWAQNELGEVFYAGKLGVVKNAVEAVKWFREAAGQNLAVWASATNVARACRSMRWKPTSGTCWPRRKGTPKGSATPPCWNCCSRRRKLRRGNGGRKIGSNNARSHPLTTDNLMSPP